MPSDRVRLLTIQTMQQNALPVLIERAGGQVEITVKEFEAMAARYGGLGHLTMRSEVVVAQGSGDAKALRLTLLDTEPPKEPVN